LGLPGPAEGGVGTASVLVRPTPAGPALHCLRLHRHDQAGQLLPRWLAEIPAWWFTDQVAAVAALKAWTTRAGVCWREFPVPRDAPLTATARKSTWLVLDFLWSSPLPGWTIHYVLAAALATLLLAALYTWWLLAIPAVMTVFRAGMGALRLRDRRRWLHG
jgi:hypothetical protein